MRLLIIGLVLFLGAHSISIVGSAWRDRVAARIGLAAWRGLYSLVAIAGFVLVVWGYGLARHAPVILYVPPFWFRYVTMFLMVFVFPLLLAAYLPGSIRDRMKHPMLVAVKLWALAHLLANGALADVVLFGSVLVWAGLDRVSLKYREPRAIRTAPASPWNDMIAVAAGLCVYLLFVFRLHAWIIGIPVLVG